MEFCLVNWAYSVLQTEQLKSAMTNYLTDGYEVMPESETGMVPFDRIKLDLSLEEIIFNCRILANFILRKKKLSFALRPIEISSFFETDKVR